MDPASALAVDVFRLWLRMMDGEMLDAWPEPILQRIRNSLLPLCERISDELDRRHDL